MMHLLQSSNRVALSFCNRHAWRLSSQLAVDAALDMSARYLDLLERLKRLSLRSDIAESELQRHYRRYEKNPHIKVVK